jgi:hypothetical protein
VVQVDEVCYTALVEWWHRNTSKHVAQWCTTPGLAWSLQNDNYDLSLPAASNEKLLTMVYTYSGAPRVCVKGFATH